MITAYSVPTANGQKIHLALEEAGLEWRYHGVDLPSGEHKSDWFLKLSPLGKAPVIVDENGPGGAPLVLAETLAIAEYVAEKAGSDLIARDPRERAEERMWTAMISSSVAMPFAMQFYATKLAPEPMPAFEAAMVTGCRIALDAFEARLSDGRPWLMGERFGIADCLFWPLCATSAQRLEGQLAPYPALKAYEARVRARPAVQRALAKGA